MKLKLLITFMLFSMIIFSCKNKPEENTSINSGLIEISKTQFESEKMEFGEPKLYPFRNLVHFTGSIVPGVNGVAQICLPLNGVITKIHCKPGQYVRKGDLLFEVSGNDFFDMQRDFAEASAVLKRMKSEFDRAKELRNENIGTEKDFILTESAFYAEQAKYNALKLKLENIGLNISVIENGTFFPFFSIKSVINGYVSYVEAAIGQYIEPQHKVAEIIDNELLQLYLSVFNNNIFKIKVGQLVNFYLNGNKSENYSAKIVSIGKTVNSNTKSIDCYAEIGATKNSNLICNQFAEGDICLAIDSLLALPQTAIINVETDSYILMLENETDDHYLFKKVKVAVGLKSSNYIELTEKIPSNKILVNGIYNIVVE